MIIKFQRRKLNERILIKIRMIHVTVLVRRSSKLKQSKSIGCGFRERFFPSPFTLISFPVRLRSNEKSNPDLITWQSVDANWPIKSAKKSSERWLASCIHESRIKSLFLMLWAAAIVLSLFLYLPLVPWRYRNFQHMFWIVFLEKNKT